MAQYKKVHVSFAYYNTFSVKVKPILICQKTWKALDGEDPG